MVLDTVLFDLDGTIIDSLPLIKRTYYQVFKEMSIPWGKEDVMNLIGLPLKEIGRLMAGEGKKQEFFDTFQRYYTQSHNKYMKYIRTFPDTIEMLSSLLERGYTLGVVTSKNRHGTDLILNHLHLKKFFMAVVTSDDTHWHKPHPQPVLYALNKLNKAHDQAVFIGDSPFDIESGNRAGVTTIAVTWGMANEKTLQDHHPKVIVHTQKELLNWFKKQVTI